MIDRPNFEEFPLVWISCAMSLGVLEFQSAGIPVRRILVPNDNCAVSYGALKQITSGLVALLWNHHRLPNFLGSLEILYHMPMHGPVIPDVEPEETPTPPYPPFIPPTPPFSPSGPGGVQYPPPFPQPQLFPIPAGRTSPLEEEPFIPPPFAYFVRHPLSYARDWRTDDAHGNVWSNAWSDVRPSYGSALCASCCSCAVWQPEQ
jgi:hypothetical protein